MTVPPLPVPFLPVPDGGLRLTGAHIVPATDTPPVHDGEIVIHGARLGYVGRRRRRPGAPDDALPEYDLGGLTVLPGFVDSLIRFETSPSSRTSAAPRFASHTHLGIADRLRRTLEAGVTTTRDLGGTDAGFRDAMAQGALLGPRLSLAVGVVRPGVDDELRRTVRTLLRSGADVIAVRPGNGDAARGAEDCGLSEETVRLAVREAAARGGRPVTVEARGSASVVRAAVRGGAADVEHCHEVDEETLRLMAEVGTVLVPAVGAVPRARQEAARRLVGRAVSAGVRVALGSDAGVIEHGANLAELGHLVDCGMTPAEAIRAGTRTAAELLGLGADLGTLERGKLADLVVTDADVLRDVTALADPCAVRMVFQGGRLLKNTL
ncbi:amidohydrolase family protein [Streptomyces sp. NPDC059629]|uniref:amidohydrolase family protein n=1 Tax=Streptomyces sp. NPDC059629 TaxID=3346889 RepID=UPI0036C23AF8